MQKILSRLSTNWQKDLLDHPDTIALLNDLKGISKVDVFNDLELGLVSIPSAGDLPEKVSKSLKSFGLLNEKYNGMISMPLRKKNNQISNFYFMSLNGKTDTIIRTGGVMNLKAFSVFKKLILVDNLDDYFAYFQQVKENIIPLIQSDGMFQDFEDTVKQSSVEEIILINDSPYWEYVEEFLKDVDVTLHYISLPESVSMSSFLGVNSPNKLLAYLEAEKSKQMKADKEEAQQKKEIFTVVEDVGELRFVAKDRQYRIRGFNRDGFEKIVQISMEIDGRVFPDKVDLSRSQGRSRFASIASVEYEMSADTIRTDLNHIYKKLDQMQDARFREKAGLHEKNAYVISRDDQKKAIDRLCKRDLLTELLMRDTERLGYVEERVNKMLFYLSATSRLTDEPVSVLDISPPGSGKSFGLSTIMDLMPPDEMLMYSRLTPNALYYKSEEDLKSKVLYIEEIVGMEESLEPIRMLLSSGELAVSVVEKDPRTGQLRTVERRISVNIPLLSSGVRDIFDEETLSRFILTYNEVSPEHISRIMKAQAYQYSLDGETRSLQRDRIVKHFRDYQKTFDTSLRVVNPFHDKIMINPRLHIVTRKQMQYLRLMYNIAFVRQHSREIKQAVDNAGNAFKYIEVYPEDVVTTNEIAEYVFRFSGSDLTKRLHDAYQCMTQYASKKVSEKKISLHEYSFSRREMREHAGWDASAAKRLFDELERLEYIRKVRGQRQGMQFLYNLVPFNQSGEKNGELHLLDPDRL